MTEHDMADEGGESPCYAHLLDEDGRMPGAESGVGGAQPTDPDVPAEPEGGVPPSP